MADFRGFAIACGGSIRYNERTAQRANHPAYSPYFVGDM